MKYSSCVRPVFVLLSTAFTVDSCAGKRGQLDEGKRVGGLFTSPITRNLCCCRPLVSCFACRRHFDEIGLLMVVVAESSPFIFARRAKHTSTVYRIIFRALFRRSYEP
jgi:hypothetical protein